MVVLATLLPWTLCLVLLGAEPARAHEAGGHAGHGSKSVRTAREGAAEPRDLGATATFDAKGALWAVYKDGQHVVSRRSDDAGRSWTAPRRVNASPEPVAAEGEARPKIAAGAAGELYVTWTRPLPKPYTGEIRFARSLDGGATFLAPYTVHTDRQEITHRFDALTVTRDQRVVVAWIDKRDQEAARAKKAPYRGAAVYFAVSDDRGATMRGDYRLADYSCECCRIALLPREGGSVVALWRHVFEPDIRDHALARFFPDGRVEPLRRATFDDWRVDACPHHGPSVAADAAGRLHAVWFTQGPGREGVRYGRLREGGVDGERRVGGDAAEHADLAAAGDRIAIAWKEFDGQRTRLRGLVSANAGQAWREVELGATTGASDQPRVLVHGGRFHVFWNTRNEPLTVVTVP